MHKRELIDTVLRNVGGIDGLSTRSQAAKAVDAVFEAVAGCIERGDTIALPGFGKFTVADRAARKGRNPQTGEEMMIPARKVPVFKAATALKNRVIG